MLLQESIVTCGKKWFTEFVEIRDNHPWIF